MLLSLKKDATGTQTITKLARHSSEFFLLYAAEKSNARGWDNDYKISEVNYFKGLNCEKSPWSQF